MEIRRLTDQHAVSYLQLRLEALERESQAFTESVVEHKAMALETIKNRLGSGSSNDNFVLGVFVDQQLVGMAGFFRRPGEARSGACTSQKSAERKASAEP